MINSVLCLASKKLGTNGWSGYLTYQSSLPYSPVPVQSPGLAYPIPTQDLSSLRLAPLPLAPLLIKPSTVVQVFLVLLVSWCAPGLPLPSLLSLSHLSSPNSVSCALPHIYNKPFPQPHLEHHVLSLFHSSGENRAQTMWSQWDI